jgi:excisionase family DNA binding protein
MPRMNPNTVVTTLSPRQLAARWCFHEESIRRMVREGRLPAIRLGKRLRVALDDILNIEAAHRVVPHGKHSTP